MLVLLTGAFGIVGRETIRVLLGAGYQVRAFDLDTKTNRKQFRRINQDISREQGRRLVWFKGNLTDLQSVGEAVRDVDVVIHLGAIIPPAADHAPLKAFYVNVGATELLVQCLERTNPTAALVFTSSISIFGDRRAEPLIRPDDVLKPNDHDWYGRQKVLAEGIVRNSGLSWSILRLTYIVSADKLAMDPLMYAMPLETSIEICHAQDVAKALIHAAEGLVAGGLAGQTFLIAGGEQCRTSYREYLQQMFSLFGLGNRWRLAESLWSTQPFHCGFMDTAKSQQVLQFQAHSLNDYYAEVAQTCRVSSKLIRTIRPLVWRWLSQRSPLNKQQSPIHAISEGLEAGRSRMLQHLAILMVNMGRLIEAGRARIKEQAAAVRPRIRDFPQ